MSSSAVTSATRPAAAVISSRRAALSGAAALAVAGPIGGLANFGFHTIAARILGPGTYAGLSALLVLTVTVAVPAAAVQMALARALLSGEAVAADLARAANRAAAVVALGTTALAPGLAELLQLGSPAPVLAMIGYLAATIIGIVPKAVLVASDRLLPIAASMVLGVVLRLGIGIAWLTHGGGLAAAVLAGSVAEAVSTALLLRVTRSDHEMTPTRQTSWRSLVGPVLGLGALWCLLAVDTVVARIAMDPAAAGSYAAAAVLARTVLFLPQSIATAAFTRLADPVTRPHALAWATATVFTVAVGAVAVLVVAGERIYGLLFGDDFSFEARVLVVLGACVALAGVMNVWIHARIAFGQPTGLRAVATLVIAATGAFPAAFAGPVVLAWWMATAAVVGLWLVRPGSAPATPFIDPTQVPAPAGTDVSIVLPAYEVGDVIAVHMLDVERTLAETGRSFEIIVVDDGSSDDTAAIAEAVAGPTTVVVRNSHRGKGAALRTGMTVARGRLIGFLDADGDIAPSVLPQLIAAAGAEGVDGAVAIKSDTRTRGLLRWAGTWGYRALAHAALAVGVSDTQTGAKVFRRSTVSAVLPWTQERGFTWDPEFLAVAERLGFQRFAEVPVSVAPTPTSIRPSLVLDMLTRTARMATRVAMLPRYDRLAPQWPDPAAPAAVPPTATVRERTRILVLNWKCQRNPAAGGAEVFTHEVIRRWACAGHDVTLFTAETAGAPEREEVDGYTVVRRGSRLGVYREARRFWQEQHEHFDVIVDEINTRPFEAPLWADVPVVALMHQLARDVWFQELPVPVAAAGRFVAEPAWLRTYRDTTIVTVSDSSASSFRRAGLSRVVDIGQGVTLPAELPAPAKAEEPTVAFVGRMVSAKRPLDALVGFDHARRRLGCGRMLMVGAGPIAPVVTNKAAATPGATYLGRVSETDKFDVLARAHALVVTSVREGWGLVVDEAAALGVHAVGYRVPGLVDSVPAAGGTLVDPSPEALGEALVRLLPDLVRAPQPPRRGGAGSWDDIAEKMLAVVESVAADWSPMQEGAA